MARARIIFRAQPRKTGISPLSLGGRAAGASTPVPHGASECSPPALLWALTSTAIPQPAARSAPTAHARSQEIIEKDGIRFLKGRNKNSSANKSRLRFFVFFDKKKTAQVARFNSHKKGSEPHPGLRHWRIFEAFLPHAAPAKRVPRDRSSARCIRRRLVVAYASGRCPAFCAASPLCVKFARICKL